MMIAPVTAAWEQALTSMLLEQSHPVHLSLLPPAVVAAQYSGGSASYNQVQYHQEAHNNSGLALTSLFVDSTPSL